MSSALIRKFYAFEGREPIHYREGTSDEAIIKAVVVDQTEYKFPKMSPKIIFDIGANIGATSVVLANIYPEAEIYAFEPEEENYSLLCRNTRPYPNIVPFMHGIGEKDGIRVLYPSDDPKNLGGFSTNIIPNKQIEGKEIRVRNINGLCGLYGTPDIIKIDCEGAEYEILLSLKTIDRVKWIAGELHGIDDLKLLDYLDYDFRLEFSRGFMDKVWHFHAVSRTWTDFGLDSKQN